MEPNLRADASALFVFGLTGGVASGKSTVARYFSEHAVTVIDADELARQVVAPGSAALEEIEVAFGAAVVHDGRLDRNALAAIVFSDRVALERLNQITHPKVAALFERRLQALRHRANPGEPTLVCYEVPLLYENGLQTHLRPVVVVACSVEQQIKRAMSRNGWSRQHAEQRIGAQMPLSEKRARADYVIDNDGTIAELEQRSAEVLERLQSEAQTRAANTDAQA